MKYTIEQLDAMPVGTVLYSVLDGEQHLFVKRWPDGWRNTYRAPLTIEVVERCNFTHIATPHPIAQTADPQTAQQPADAPGEGT